MASEDAVWRLVSRCGTRGPRTWKRGKLIAVFFRSSVLKAFAFGVTLTEVVFWNEKTKENTVTSKDEKIHDFSGRNNDYQGPF